jgi:hypothetical protein
MRVVFEGGCWLIGFATARFATTAPSLGDGEHIATYRRHNGVIRPPFIDSASLGSVPLEHSLFAVVGFAKRESMIKENRNAKQGWKSRPATKVRAEWERR